MKRFYLAIAYTLVFSYLGISQNTTSNQNGEKEGRIYFKSGEVIDASNIEIRQNDVQAVDKETGLRFSYVKTTIEYINYKNGKKISFNETGVVVLLKGSSQMDEEQLSYSKNIFSDIWSKGVSSFGIGGELALPIGDMGISVGLGYGGFVLFQYGISHNLVVIGHAGYSSFSSKNNGWETFKINEMIFLSGLKYNFGTGIYFITEVGVNLVKRENNFSYSFFTYYYSGSSTYNDTKFAIYPGIGYQVANFDISLKYAVLPTYYNNLAMNVAFIIPL